VNSGEFVRGVPLFLAPFFFQTGRLKSFFFLREDVFAELTDLPFPSAGRMVPHPFLLVNLITIIESPFPFCGVWRENFFFPRRGLNKARQIAVPAPGIASLPFSSLSLTRRFSLSPPLLVLLFFLFLHTGLRRRGSNSGALGARPFPSFFSVDFFFYG